MGQGRANITERRSKGQPLGRLDKNIGRGATALKFETDHIASILPDDLARQSMIGMIQPFGIQHPLHPRQPTERLSQVLRILLRTFKPEVKGQQATLGQPAIKRACGQACRDRKIKHLLTQLRGFGRNISQRNIRMSRQQLRHRMNHNIRTSQKRLHRPGGGECIVDCQQNTPLLSQGHQSMQIRHPQRWVGHNLDQDQLGFRSQRGAHRCQTARIGKTCCHAKSRQIVLQHPQ